MNEIIERLNEMLISKYPADQVNEIEMLLRSILYDYDITKKETAVTVYSGDEDERAIKKFLATKLVQGCSQRTIKYYQSILNFFKSKINKPLLEITTDDILYYLAIRGTVDKISACSQDNELRVFRTFYGYLATEEMIEKNPTLKISKIKGTKKVKTAFTETELELMRNACNNNRKGTNLKHLAIIEVLISTGCRASELADMKLENLAGDKIRIIGKGNKERWVYLNARALVALNNWLKERKFNSPYIFTGENIATGEQTEKLNGESVNDIVKRIAQRAGVEGAHAHKFRRTAATLALRRGMPIEMVSKMLGHEQLGTTQIYLQITDDELEAAHKKYC